MNGPGPLTTIRDRIAGGELTAEAAVRAGARRHRPPRPGAPRLHRSDRRRRPGGSARRRRRADARRAAGRRWPASRSRSRTTSAPARCRPRRPRRYCAASSRPTTPPWCRGSPPPAPSSSARPTATSSRWAPPPRTRPTARPAIPGRSIARPGDRAADRPRRWPAAWCRRRSAPIPAARSASRRRSAAWSGSSRPTAGSRATACSPSRRHSIRSDPSPRPPTTPPWCWRRLPAATCTTRPAPPARCPTGRRR